jgi:hypothetical protein
MGSIAHLFRSPEPESRPAAPGTIGGLIEAGHGLTATCEVCLHSARLNLPDLAARLGAEHPCGEADLRPHLQCSVCKSVDSSLEETRPERHGTPRPSGLIPSDDSQLGRSSSSSRDESRDYRERHAGRSPSA